MMNTHTHPLPLLAVLWLLLGATAAQAITFTPFLASGAGGRVNGQTLIIGPGGEVEELDAYIGIGGLDLNGAADGVTAPIGSASLPAGLDYSFDAELSADTTDLTLRYSFANNTGSAVNDITFLSFIDAEIDERVNTFFNEYATVFGSPAAGQAYEVDEPGVLFGDIRDNIDAGVLDGANAVPVSAPEDVSMAMSFALSELAAGGIFEVAILVSEDGDRLGPLWITQLDTASFGTKIIYSGEASVVVPEPRILLGIAALTLLAASRRRR